MNEIERADLVLVLAKAWQQGILDEPSAEDWVRKEYDFTSSSFHHQSEWLRITIRTDDLKLIEAITDGVKAAAHSGFLQFIAGSSQVVPTAAIVGIAFAVAKICWSLRHKMANLDPLQWRVLAILRASRPVTDIELLEAALISGKPGTDGWSIELIRDTLQSLTKARLKDGTIVPLVAQDGDLRWGAAGV
jgi:hypothetical protein